MINYLEGSVTGLCIHKVGNPSQNEELVTTSRVITIEDDELEVILKRFFFDAFKYPEYYHFDYTSGELELNPIYNFVSNIFDNQSLLLEQSIKIARHLYEKSHHPNIKAGDLMIAMFDGVLIGDEVLRGLAIFKSEQKDDFLKLDIKTGSPSVTLDRGVNLKRLDKACLVFDTERDTGYKVCVLDRSNSSKDAQYWKDEFLYLTPRKDDYYATSHLISVAKNFVKTKMKSEEGHSALDRSDILVKTKKFLNEEEVFDLQKFEEQLFGTQPLRTTFHDFVEEYETQKEISLPDKFDISGHAVQKNTKYIRSVIKLDKNFHIYVHGDRSKIERGEDEKGKYYKLYYDQEK